MDVAALYAEIEELHRKVDARNAYYAPAPERSSWGQHTRAFCKWWCAP
jgi:hypothetical protein